ncbi:aldo/keto reductase [Enemella evansiae]|uniref:aldo/keto reductase n=1 Tax=Enemella evansiae TaxID=2016499 RepID=UPI001E461ED6|nr:aldo/keto reductase [Enemella evansiae]
MTTAMPWADSSPPPQGLGLMRVREEHWGDPERDPGGLVRAAVDAGVRVLDTAEMYGNEAVVGRAIGTLRDDVILCSKFGVYWGDSGRFDDWSVRADPATVRNAIDGSLKRLGTDRLDLYYLHHRSDETPIEETVGAMAELQRAGKIRSLGLSNVTVEDIRRAHRVHPIHAVQEQWSITHREVEDMLPVLAELQITLVAHSPLGHGELLGSDGAHAATIARLAEKYAVSAASLAVAWVHNRARQLGQSVTVLPGTTRAAHIRPNVAAASLRIDDEDLDELTRVGG